MKLTSFKETQEYLESFIRPSVFERIKEDSHMIDPLDRMRVLLSLLGDPQKEFKSVQVSGTSGKGSTAYLLANILEKAGYKTGLATSPHLQSINERMQIDMRKISNEDLIGLVESLIPAIEKIKKLPEGEPSYFELLTAMAFMYFAQKQVDIAVVEVGLEGKYDATNVLDPLVIILTNISRDHVELLGNNEEEIANEAFSIIRKNEIGDTPIIVTGVDQGKLKDLILIKANSIQADLKILGRDFTSSQPERTKSGTRFSYLEGEKRLADLEVRLRGGYQMVNASLAIASAQALGKQGFNITDSALRNGLSTAFFPGRFEVIISSKQIVILDGAHNEAKMKAFLQALHDYYPTEEKVFIVGFKRNKDIETMLRELLNKPDYEFIFTEFSKTGDYARSSSLSLSELKTNVESIGSRAEVFYQPNVQGAFTEAKNSTKKIIVVTGSLYLVGEMRELIFPTE